MENKDFIGPKTCESNMDTDSQYPSDSEHQGNINGSEVREPAAPCCQPTNPPKDKKEETKEGENHDNIEICRDYMRGTCMRIACIFKHEFPENADVTFCRNFQNKECTIKPCKYIHAMINEQCRFYRTGRLPDHVRVRDATSVAKLSKMYTFCEDYRYGACNNPRCRLMHVNPLEEIEFRETGILPISVFERYFTSDRSASPPPSPATPQLTSWSPIGAPEWQHRNGTALLYSTQQTTSYESSTRSTWSRPPMRTPTFEWTSMNSSAPATMSSSEYQNQIAMITALPPPPPPPISPSPHSSGSQVPPTPPAASKLLSPLSTITSEFLRQQIAAILQSPPPPPPEPLKGFLINPQPPVSLPPLPQHLVVPPQQSIFPPLPPDSAIFPPLPPKLAIFPPLPPEPSVIPTTAAEPSVIPTTASKPSVIPPMALEPTVSPTTAPEPSLIPRMAPEPSVIPPMAPEPSVIAPMASEPSAIPPMASEPSVMPPMSPEPLVIPPMASEPSVIPPMAPEPSVIPPMAPEPSVIPPMAPGPSVISPMAPEPSVIPPMAPGPSVIPPMAPGLSVIPPIAPEPSVIPPMVGAMRVHAEGLGEPPVIPPMTPETSVNPLIAPEPSVIPPMPLEPSVISTMAPEPSVILPVALETSVIRTTAPEPSVIPTMAPEPSIFPLLPPESVIKSTTPTPSPSIQQLPASSTHDDDTQSSSSGTSQSNVAITQKLLMILTTLVTPPPVAADAASPSPHSVPYPEQLSRHLARILAPLEGWQSNMEYSTTDETVPGTSGTAMDTSDDSAQSGEEMGPPRKRAKKILNRDGLEVLRKMDEYHSGERCSLCDLLDQNIHVRRQELESERLIGNALNTAKSNATSVLHLLDWYIKENNLEHTNEPDNHE